MKVTLLAQYPHEATKIAHWYYDEWACQAENVSLEMVVEDVKQKSLNRNKVPLAIIAREDNDLVGVAEIKCRENPNYPDYTHWLGGVFVPIEARGLGISSLLINHALHKAKKLGILEIYLQCETHNIKLYQRHGFQTLHLAEQSDPSVVIMRIKMTKQEMG